MQKKIIYHNNCYDGVTSAWVAHRYWYGEADYIPMNYSDIPVINDFVGKDIFIIDFSFKRDMMRKLASVAKSITVLDHHKTAEAELKGLNLEFQNVEIIFDMERSGAGIAWDYFFGPDSVKGNRESMPDLVRYVQDRDLWKFELENSHEVNAWIQSYPINLNTWIDEVNPEFGMHSLDEIIEQGRSILRFQQALVSQIVDQAVVKPFIFDCPDLSILAPILRPGQTIFTVPYVQTSVLMSEVCHEMLNRFQDYDMVMYSFDRKDGKRQYGLRSRPDYDCSVFAKSMGGGGHKNAAGFEVNID